MSDRCPQGCARITAARLTLLDGQLAAARAEKRLIVEMMSRERAEHREAVAAARADQREATIRHAAEWLQTLGRDDLAVALVRDLSITVGS